MEAYDATAIANKFITLAKQDNIPVTNMKLQKLVYIAHGYCWAILNRPLINNDVHAFEFGPVIPTLYNRLKKYGSSPVESPVQTDNPELSENGLAENLVKRVWDAYKNLGALKLSAITHESNTPWEETWQTNRYGIIPPDAIKKHYEQLLNERAEIRPQPNF